MVALRKEFDEGVEPDSRGRLCSPEAAERRMEISQLRSGWWRRMK
jgi:hypothetical protein